MTLADRDREGSGVPAYAKAWLTTEDLDSLNRRIHDGVPVEQLMNRARGYRDWLFGTFPDAQPAGAEEVVELGSGVGWIMQAVLERFASVRITGLDISANMIEQARRRLEDPRASFVRYDGLRVPLATDSVPLLYSVAVLQHVEKHHAFLLFEELQRVIQVGGHCILHLLAIDHLPGAAVGFHDECLHHVENLPTHWHHYYAFDELFVLFSEVLAVSDLGISYEPISKSFLVHFSKGGDRRYLDDGLPNLRYVNRLPA